MNHENETGREIRQRISAKLLGLDKGVRCCPLCFRWHQNGTISKPGIKWPDYWRYEKCPDCLKLN